MLCDGETWEVVNDEMVVLEVSKDTLRRLMDGEKPKHLPDRRYRVLARVPDLLRLVESRSTPLH